MHFQLSAAAIAASLSLASAAGAIRGFNSGSTTDGGANKQQSDFQAEFSNQKQITGSDGQFNSARLYTMIQGGTTSDPISAIPAAIAENTGLLLGLWASAGQDNFNNELAALKASIEQYGDQLATLAQGISVGSEDLYRISVTGIKNSDGLPGAAPSVVADYISQVRSAIAGTKLANVPIGHVDTWNAYTNSSNQAVIDACDWIGVDEYPYYQSQDSNPISNNGPLFYQAIDKVKAVAGGKDVWITETGYPSSGPTVGEAVASVANAHQYWLDVYCTLPESTPVYWYIQYQAQGSNTANFGLTGNSLSTTPIFDLSCAAASNTTSSSSSSSSATSTSHSAKATSTDVTSTASATNATTTATHRTGGGAGGATTTTTPSTSSVGLLTAKSSGLTSSVQTFITTTPAPSVFVSAPYTNGTLVTSTMTGTGLSAPVTTSTPTPSSTPLPPANGSPANNVQVYTLALLIVPAALAFMM